MLLPSFQNFISKNKLIGSNDKLLLAVSGGVDSMVLMDLCLKSGLNFAVAHVNFKLRGAASDTDEELVIATCKANNIACYTTSFDTVAYTKQHKISIQMAARELRYSYFEQLIKTHQFTKLLTAHHANDSLETFFINLLRSSGIQGLTGIPIINKYIIRPLLFAEKSAIEKYAVAHKIIYQTDVSNLKDDYLRNQIRHHIIPAFQNINENAVNQLLNSMYHLQREHELLQELHQKALDKIISKHPQGIQIDITLLKTFVQFETMLLLYLKNYGFNHAQVMQMLDDTSNQTGSLFYSKTHRVLYNRDVLIVSILLKSENNNDFIIHNINQKVDHPFFLKMQELLIDNINYKTASSNEAYVDAAKVQFPLTIRKWKQGDSIIPLGMKQRKKISDILIGQKVDLIMKENIYVLCNANGDIIWLIGQRLSDNFKVEKMSSKLYYFSFENELNGAAK
jgi:tRNA(Ile)-lysidine synthase